MVMASRCVIESFHRVRGDRHVRRIVQCHTAAQVPDQRVIDRVLHRGDR
jgi:hypothetical protein